MSVHADLTSVLSTIDQILERLDEATTSLDAAEREDLVNDLHEVERHLRSAGRRLTRTLRALSGGPGT